MGLAPSQDSWALQRHLLTFVERSWRRPDHGIWEVRSQPRRFTHSAVMTWVAIDRAIKSVQRFGLDGPLDAWLRLRAEIHSDVCRQG